MDWLHILLVLGRPLGLVAFAACLPYRERSFALVQIGLRVGTSTATDEYVPIAVFWNMLLSRALFETFLLG